MIALCGVTQHTSSEHCDTPYIRLVIYKNQCITYTWFQQVDSEQPQAQQKCPQFQYK